MLERHTKIINPIYGYNRVIICVSYQRQKNRIIKANMTTQVGNIISERAETHVILYNTLKNRVFGYSVSLRLVILYLTHK